MEANRGALFVEFHTSDVALFRALLVILTFIYVVVETQLQLTGLSTLPAFADGPVENVFPGSTYEVEIIEDIVYAQGLRRSGWNVPGREVMDLKLDAYLPIAI